MAKSKPRKPIDGSVQKKQETLHEHTHAVENAVGAMTDALAEPLSHVAPADFAAMLQHAAFFHDLGKAATGFQLVVSPVEGKKSPRWNYRHEALSTAILMATGLAEKSDPRLLPAVLTHHRPFDDNPAKNDCLATIIGRGNGQDEFDSGAKVKWDRKVGELQTYWPWIKNYIAEAERSGRIPTLPNPLPDHPSALPNLFEEAQAIEISLEPVQGISSETLPWILARGFLMGGDHLASANLGAPLTEVNSSKVRPAEGFQTTLQTVRGNAFLEAPTGSGKTEAALHWALANRDGGERIFYVLPYQASINKMTERLQTMFGLENVGALHHRAALQEFTRHFESSDEEDPQSRYNASTEHARKRIDQSKQFYRPVKVLTPYQLLKLMFGCRFFEIGLAELLGGLVIFDEIHAYDARVAALLEIMIAQLQTLRVRFLFMSATFPDDLKRRLTDALGPCSTVKVEEEDPRAASLLHTARHRLFLDDKTLEAMEPDIIAAAKKGQKVLVVCNRVAQAQAFYETLSKKLSGYDVRLLHSRFIGKDRTAKEATLAANPNAETPEEQQVPSADVLVATQVVEVSLNLSFDTCFTEAAPVDALLQRFGRVNRANQHGQPVEVHVARLYDEKAVSNVYSSERMELTLKSAPQDALMKAGADLLAEIESRWVCDTYANGFTAKEKEKYDSAHRAFTETTSQIKPYYSGKDEDFYELFDNYNVVPVRFKHDYKKAIADKCFFDAAGFVVSLSCSTFMGMQSHTDYDTQNHIYYIDRLYDTDRGLLNEPETDRSFVKKDIDELFR